MASNVDFLIGFLLGILPGLAVLWISLRRFDRPHVDHTLFDDRQVFGSLAVGLVFGTIASVFTLSVAGAAVVPAVAFALSLLLEESFKLAWLNRRSYRGRFDATFYGIPLGIGAAASGVVATAWATQREGNLYALETLALLVVYSFGLCLANADSGSLIGFGASRGETWRPFARALAVRFGHGVLLIPFFLGNQLGEPYASLSAGTALGFALLVFYYVYRVILPGTLPEEIRREIRRARRRAAPRD
jgi:hypothetical protein